MTLYNGGSDSLVATADRMNQDGVFVTLYGQEFSSISKGNHINVFDIPDVIDDRDVPTIELDCELHTRDEFVIVYHNGPGLIVLNSWISLGLAPDDIVMIEDVHRLADKYLSERRPGVNHIN